MLTTSIPAALRARRGGHRPRRVETDRGIHLDRHDELPWPARARKIALLGERDGSRAPGARPERDRARTGAGRQCAGPRAQSRASCVGGPGHPRGGARSASRAPASSRSSRRRAHAELEEASRVDAEVLRRRDVDHPLVDAAREARRSAPRYSGSPPRIILSSARGRSSARRSSWRR